MKNREIKFRAFDTEMNQYVKNQFILSSVKGIEIILSGVSIDGDADDSNEEILFEQFTGLKDKNGKDIYEGDLIRYSNKIEHGNGTIEFNAGFIILWDLKTVKSKSPMLMSPMFYFQCSAEIEVIGNIHENPELLNT